MSKPAHTTPARGEALWSVATRSHCGYVREDNQDAWRADPARGLFIVADGMGGMRAGATAAGMVCALLPRALADRRRSGQSVEETEEILRDAVMEVSRDVLHAGQRDRSRAAMGSTVVCALAFGRQVIIAGMGDSRAYLYRHGVLTCLTTDHTMAAVMSSLSVFEGNHPLIMEGRHFLTRYMGMPYRGAPDMTRRALQPGDKLLLCSDGLHGMLDDNRIEALCKGRKSLDDLADLLVAEALDAGGDDNVTVMLIRREAGSPSDVETSHAAE